MTTFRENAARLQELLDEERKLRASAEEENRRLAQELLAAGQQQQELLNLYVASRRLHESLDRSDVLAAIQEIVINLIGSEELGVFELSDDRKALCLVSAFGLESTALQRIPLGRGPIGEAAERGEPVLGEGPEGSHLTAVVPLKVDGDLIGAVAIFRMLPQKPALSANDREIIDLLATHAAIALRSSGAKGPRE